MARQRRKFVPCILCEQGTLDNDRVCPECRAYRKQGIEYQQKLDELRNAQDRVSVHWLTHFDPKLCNENVEFPSLFYKREGSWVESQDYCLIPRLLEIISGSYDRGASPGSMGSGDRVIARWNFKVGWDNHSKPAMLEPRKIDAIEQLYLCIHVLYKAAYAAGASKADSWLTAMAQGNATIDEINARVKTSQR